MFDGKIITPDGTYYVERANKYALPSTNASLHSVIYGDRDVHDPYDHMRTGELSHSFIIYCLREGEGRGLKRNLVW